MKDDSCNFNILYESANGVVTCCHSCGNIQLAFHTSHHTLTQAQFRDLESRLQDEILLMDMPSKEGASRKMISLEVDHPASRLILSYFEALELQNILRQSILMSEVQSLIR